MAECDAQLGFDPVEIGRQELHVEVPRRRVLRPRPRVLLIGAEQHAVALLADVDLAGEVHRHRHLATGRRHVLPNILHRLGDEVVVLHRQHREFETGHPTDLAGPQPARVDDVFGMDLAAFGDDRPRAVRPVFEPTDPVLSGDLGAGLPGTDRVGVGDTRGVDVALDRVPHRSEEVLRVEQREQFLGLPRRDHLELVHAEVPTAGDGHAQPVHPVAVGGEGDATGQVDRAVLPRAFLDLAVELHGVLLELGHVRVAVEGVHPTGRVPGRSGGQLLALDEQHVGPPVLGQVEQHRRADDTAADHHHLR